MISCATKLKLHVEHDQNGNQLWDFDLNSQVLHRHLPGYIYKPQHPRILIFYAWPREHPGKFRVQEKRDLRAFSYVDLNLYT